MITYIVFILSIIFVLGFVGFSSKPSPIYGCLGNPMDRGAWWATVRGISEELDMTEHAYAYAIEHFCVM